MAAVSLSDVAHVAVQDFKMGSGSTINPAMARELTTIIELALLTAVRDERRACIAECTRRGELWEQTAEKLDVSAPLRVEAQSRANEARCLADLIVARR
jgi:hypothetical protein